MRSGRARLGILVGTSTLLVLGVIGPVPHASAQIITPDVFTDDNTANGNCTLREAILSANTNAVVDTCQQGAAGADIISIPPGPYLLDEAGAPEDTGATGDLDITEGLTLQRMGTAGTVTIDGGDGGGLDRILHVLGGSVTLTDLTIINGDANGDGSGHGGGILMASSGTLSLDGVTVTGNVGTNGGGVATTAGILSMTASTVSDNIAGGSGGGVSVLGTSGSISASTIGPGNQSGSTAGGVQASVPLTITTSSIVGNQTVNGGGGVAVGPTTVTITDSTVSSNTVTNTFGGGVTNGTPSGDLTIVRSTISGNHATNATNGRGAGINNGGTLTLRNSTISGNEADQSGGGLYSGGSATSTLNNVTITENVADFDGNGAGDGGGLVRPTAAPFTIRNTIIAGNTDASPTVNEPDCGEAASWTSGGHNLIGNDTGCVFTPTTGDVVDAPALLGPLQNNGGTTETHLPAPTSPAVDGGNPATPDGTGDACEAKDQRFLDRPLDGDGDDAEVCDIGAVEIEVRHLSVAVTGPGTVTAPGISCPGDCEEEEALDQAVTLIANPDTGAEFDGWGGDCASEGTATTCDVTMSAARSVTATFSEVSTTVSAKSVTLSPSKKKVVKGKKVLLTAGVLPCSGHEGDLINFMKGSKQIASLPSNQACVASVKVKMRRKGTFTAESPQQDADHGAGTSPAVTVKVKKPK